MDARLTLTTTDEGNFCAGQKGLAGAFTIDQIMFAADNAREKGQSIRRVIERAISDGKVEAVKP